MDTANHIDKSPEEMLAGNSELTDVELRKQSKLLYSGKVMRVSGKIDDVEFWSRAFRVYFYTNGHSSVVAAFHVIWEDRVSSLKKGECVEVLGKIDYVMSNHIGIKECVLLPPDLSLRNISPGNEND